MIGNNIKGFYFWINNDEKNICRSVGNMFPCFQRTDDLLAVNSWTRRYYMFLESFLTAPYGTIRSVTNIGEIICANGQNNQKYFKERIAINKGVKTLIRDMNKLDCEDAMQIDEYYGWMYSSMRLSDNISKIFYSDDQLTGNKQIKIFEK